jgi:hypothetical protein
VTIGLLRKPPRLKRFDHGMVDETLIGRLRAFTDHFPAIRAESLSR